MITQNEKDIPFDVRDECNKLLREIDRNLVDSEGTYPEAADQDTLSSLVSVINLISEFGNQHHVISAQIAKSALLDLDSSSKSELAEGIIKDLEQDLLPPTYKYRSQYNIGVLIVLFLFFTSSLLIFLLSYRTIIKPFVELGNVRMTTLLFALAVASTAHLVSSSKDSFISKQPLLGQRLAIVRGAILTVGSAFVGFFGAVFCNLVVRYIEVGYFPENWFFILTAVASTWFYDFYFRSVRTFVKKKVKSKGGSEPVKEQHSSSEPNPQ